MKRVFFIDTDEGVRRLEESDFPLSIGGAGTDIVIGETAAATILAHIALSSGHAYIQPFNDSVELFHNHEHIDTSAWLKSGDRIQLAKWVLCWDVKGDQVFVKVSDTDGPDLKPSLSPPPSPPPAPAEEENGEGENESAEEDQDTVVIPIVTASISPKKQRGLRYLVFGLFALLSLVALFVLFATPMSVSITPEPDTQSISGFPPPVSFGSRMLAVGGSYTVHATRKGYQPLDQEIDVKSDGFQAFSFELKELPGHLKINVDPLVPITVSIAGFGAETGIEVNDDNSVYLERGTQTIRITTERYLEESLELEIAGYGESQEIDISLLPAWANAQLISVPEGAEILIDEENIGTTPLTAEIMQGQRRLEFSLDGYKTVGLQEEFFAGTSVELESIILEPNDGMLLLSSRPSGATVSVDGVFKGATPVSIVLTSGVSHQLSLSKPGYLPGKKVVKLGADEEQQLRVDLAPEYGIVFSSSKPADASLTVDGKSVGSGTQRLRLTTRPHELTFSKPGYVTQTVKISPRTDTSQNIDISLKTEAQAKEDARPAVLRTAGGQEMPLLEPSGNFHMGASRREAGRRANESQRLVTITKPFYLGSREVTNAEYRLFNKKHNSGSAEGVSLNADNSPVVNVSWEDAARYCNWLSVKDKLPPAYVETDGHMKLLVPATSGYRLPTEAEWVYVARVTGRKAEVRYSWGESYPPPTAAGNFADAQIADTLANVVTGYNDGYRGPAPVASFTAFPAGFHDLGGNVAEWINDFYAVYPGQAEKLVTDPAGPASGDHHVVRGSSWRDGSITELRLSYRDYSRAPRDNLGFRIARYADE